jgi:DNA repair exonuclease SbcCD ATPase subunit
MPKLANSSLAQWVSAITAVGVAFFGIWAFFFSPASTALINYLHSELAVRNSRIVELEARERDLQSSIGNREKELARIEQKTGQLQADVSALSDQRDLLQRQISAAEQERSRLEEQAKALAANLSRSEFQLVKEKIYTTLSSTIVSTVPLRLSSEFYSAEGVKPRKVSIWPDYLDLIRSSIAKLSEKERPLGQEVLKAFLSQCGGLRNGFVALPALKSSKVDYSEYLRLNDEQRKQWDIQAAQKKTDALKQLDALSERIRALDDQIRVCFSGVKQG